MTTQIAALKSQAAQFKAADGLKDKKQRFEALDALETLWGKEQYREVQKYVATTQWLAEEWAASNKVEREEFPISGRVGKGQKTWASDYLDEIQDPTAAYYCKVDRPKKQKAEAEEAAAKLMKAKREQAAREAYAKKKEAKLAAAEQ